MFDFSNLSERKTKTVRKGGSGGAGRKGVQYDIRLVQSQKRTTFQIHSDYMEKMGFVNGKGFYNALAPNEKGENGVFALIVAEDHKKCLFFSPAKGGGDKSNSFKGDVLLNDLVNSGLITLINPESIEDRKPNYQYLTLVKQDVAAEKLPQGVEAAYLFAKGEAIEPEVSEDDDDSADDSADDASDFGDAPQGSVDEPATADLEDDEWQ